MSVLQCRGFAYHPRCLEYLKTLDKKIRKQILKKVEQLVPDPYPPTCKQLHGQDDNGQPIYRVRSGDYRILYVVRGMIVCVLDIDNRKDVYR